MALTVTVAYEVGSKIRLSPTFTDIDRVLTDPDTVTARVKDPAGAVTVYTYAGGDIIRDSVGLYHLDFLADKAGEWFYRTEGTGAVYEADEGSFTVRTSEVI